MTKIEKLLSTYTHDAKTCVHDGGFHCTTISKMQQGDSFYAFACNHFCGYFMNISPDAAGKIENKAYPENADKHWRDIGVIYTEGPGQRSDGREWKIMAPFAKGGKL